MSVNVSDTPISTGERRALQDRESSAPMVEGQSDESKQVFKTFIDRLESAASSADAVAASGTVAPYTGKIEDQPDEVREAILRKVATFLDVNLQGPMFFGDAGGKLFVGEFPRRQQLIDVQSIVGNRRGENELSIGQENKLVINTLLSVLLGWLPKTSPKAQVLRANLTRRSDWERLGITLNRVEWMESRDPYVFEREIGPLWEQYEKWREVVEPTRAEIDFYYSLMQ